MRAHLVARAKLDPLWSLDRVPGVGAWLAHTVAGDLLVLGDDLAVRCGVRLPAAWKGGHAVSADLTTFAASGEDRVAAYDPSGGELWTVPHEPWSGPEAGACAFTADDTGVWALVRTPEGECLHRYDRADGALRRSAVLPAGTDAGEFLTHPGGAHVVLTGRSADDVHRVLVVDADGDAPAVEQPPGGTRIAADLHPRGDLLLTAPADDGPLALVRHPDGALVAARRSDQVFLDQDEVFDIYAGFVATDAVLAASSGGRHMLFSVPDLRPLAEVEYPEDETGEWVVVRHDGVWLTADADSGEVRVWCLVGE